MNVAIILPDLPPRVTGIGDYVCRLWLQLTGMSELTLDASLGYKFVVQAGCDESRKLFPLASIDNLLTTSEGIASSLERLDVDAVLLQYVSYGYHPRGLPFHLSEGLAKWRQAKAHRRLITMFHECWATGYPPWQSAFWYWPMQKHLARQLVLISDISVTSNNTYREWLLTLAKDRAIREIPLGCSFFATTKGSARNWREFLIFGLRRERAIEIHQKLLKLIWSEGLIDKIVLAGPHSDNLIDTEASLLAATCPGLPVIKQGVFPANEIPLDVASCGISLIDTPSALLGKSSRYQLACLLGQVAISKYSGEPGGPMESGTNFLYYGDKSRQTIIELLRQKERLERISRSAYELSQGPFSWSTLGAAWRELLSFK